MELKEIIKQNQKSQMTFSSVSNKFHKYNPLEGLIEITEDNFVIFIDNGIKTCVNLKNVDYITIN